MEVNTMKVSLRAMVLAVAMTTPAWLSASAGEGLTIRFIGGEAYDVTANQVSYNTEMALGGGCAAPAGCAAAAPSCGAAAPSCGADAACGCDDSCNDCCDFDFGPFLPCKRWAVFAGAPIMVRQNLNGGLVRGGALPESPDDEVLVGPNAGVYSGFQGNIIRYRENGRDIDIGFMTIGNGNRLGFDVLFQPAVLDPVGYLGDVSAVATQYNSNITSIEANLRLRKSDWFSWIAGVRWINLSEDLLFLAVGDQNAAAGYVTTNNNLLGFQLGGSAILAAHGRWTFNGQIRAGVYYNDCDATAAGLVEIPVYATGDANPTAFEADAQLTASLWVSDHFAIRFGYQVMWLDRVALANNQFTSQDIDQIDDYVSAGLRVNTNATPFWHGALVQGEFVW
jgi:hypothetical protein